MKYALAEIYEIFLHHPICTDSRKIQQNQLFIALQGATFDGNRYAAEALAKGCKYAIVDDPEVCIDDRYILVADALKTLQRLANYHRKKINVPILAITGSNGKTTTKELLKNVLSQKYRTFSTTGNYNNHIGVPLSLLAIEPSVEFAIIEMGANHRGEIAELCQIAAPNYGIITNVGYAHLKGFDSFEGVKKGKGELYAYLRKNKGVAFVHQANKHLQTMLPPGLETIFYDASRYRIKSIAMNPYLTIRLEDMPIKTKLFGEYNLENILAAFAVGEYFNIPMKKIIGAIESYMPENWRSQLIHTKKNTLILDNYNANPVSMVAAIQSFEKIKTDKSKVLILGDMLELGTYSDREHRKIVELIANKKFYKTLLVGKQFGKLSSATDFLYFKNVEKLKEFIAKNPVENSYILLKASRTLQLEKVIPYL